MIKKIYYRAKNKLEDKRQEKRIKQYLKSRFVRDKDGTYVREFTYHPKSIAESYALRLKMIKVIFDIWEQDINDFNIKNNSSSSCNDSTDNNFHS